MKKYKVKEGCEVYENNTTYKAGDVIYLALYRAIQLGIDNFEEVPETPASESNDLTAENEKLRSDYAALETEYSKEKDYSKSLSEKAEKLETDLKSAIEHINTLTAENEKLKKGKK